MGIRNLTARVYEVENKHGTHWQFDVLDGGTPVWTNTVRCPDQHHASRKAGRFLSALASDRDRLRVMGVALSGVDDLATLVALIVKHLRPADMGGCARTSWEVCYQFAKPDAERQRISKCCLEPVGENAVRAFTTDDPKPIVSCPCCGAAGCEVKHYHPQCDTMAAKLPSREDVRKPAAAFYAAG